MAAERHKLDGAQADIIVLAIGNSLRSDDGVGIHALERLRSDPRLPPNVHLIDGGLMGPELLSLLEGCDALLIIDAVAAGANPGELVRIEGDAVPAAWEQMLSTHQAGIGDLLAQLRMLGPLPRHLVVHGIQPLTVDWGLELSGPVAESLDSLIDRILDELRSWRSHAHFS